MEDIRVIDADAHLLQDPAETEVREHMPGSQGSVRYGATAGSMLPAPVWDPTDGGTLGPLSVDLDTRIKAMDQEGIHTALLFPTRALNVTLVRDKGFAAVYCRAYNDYVASLCRKEPRLKGAAVVPFQDPEAAVVEANRAVTELGLAGIVLASRGLKEPMGSQHFWPIYEELQRLGVPLLVHSSYAGPGEDRRADTFLMQSTVGRMAETLSGCAGLLYGGVPEIFPNLKVAFLDAGCGWVAYWIERMDRDFENHGSIHAPLLKALPGEYMSRGNWYYSTPPDEKGLPYLLEIVGEDVVTFASTYPDPESQFPNAVALLRQRTDISEAAKKKILGENASRLLGLN
jgi:predicted TIM-barrel fold metal-dependent hydrolase